MLWKSLIIIIFRFRTTFICLTSHSFWFQVVFISYTMSFILWFYAISNTLLIISDSSHFFFLYEFFSLFFFLKKVFSIFTESSIWSSIQTTFFHGDKVTESVFIFWCCTITSWRFVIRSISRWNIRFLNFLNRSL